MYNQRHTCRGGKSHSQSCLQFQTTISLRTVWNKEKSCIVKWCPDWPHTGIIFTLSFFRSFHFTTSFISHISVLSFPAIFLPSFICPYSACSLVFAHLYPDHLLIITLSLLLLLLIFLLLLLLILLLLHPILIYHHLSSSHQDFIFSFWLPKLFLLIILLYFIIQLWFCPLLFLSSTSSILHIFSLNHIFLLQYLLNFYIFYLNFSPLSLRHLFLVPFFTLPVNPISDSGVVHYWLC